MKSQDMHNYRMNWNALVHAIFATLFATYCVLYTCPDGKTFLKDQYCREVVRNSHVLTMFYSCSYLVVDTIIILVYDVLRDETEKLTLVHHLLAFFNMYLAFWK